ncbi:MAG TPA: DUF397 domain-containing protein [Actinophytocola sp.]|uniref:DUF397 domain-containing protein n=1 Tax=Actinophytocola sp. TaxID=1872138 RepID=UPI002DDD8A16|nr:DUF397 domain-containing protein [Actinophytocola sp.]HEV2781483.1 DUF397 domain-containing protein [Actinophytocola sp.]
MSTVDLQGLTWRKSSRSGGTGTNDNCVEIALAGPVIAVRDSKNPFAGALTFPATALTELRASL